MEKRINPYEMGFGTISALSAFGKQLAKSPVEKKLLHLLYYRVSQINGCAFCLDMHSKDLRAIGETEQRLYMMDAWRESPFYTRRERAALAWAEAVTRISETYVPDDVYQEALKEFSEAELIDITLGILAINCYNRINISFRIPAGTYKVGQFDTAENLVEENN